MSLPNRPKFSYDSGTTLTMTWPALEWLVLHGSVGGVRFAAAPGYAASHVIRRDRDLGVTIRVTESERTSVETFVEWAQGMASFTFWPDADVTGTSYSVILVSPAAGESWQFQRDQEYPRLFTLRLVLRKADGSQWTDVYHS